ncbi:hypothetical protein Desac_1160 [Desulfobacca acetoxidans DSM 11109]|uniref:Uncharacterized protein n=1 Tax=Desulfobacca acetoxidans (strain ATCC 700848 / DSM 11109 / ASRB2) TaxID=880072 RepID=F2NCF9_DESAR|nr:hypothetical protein Desac_1160 [Desulfobacca acetoxidans DSM 11109]
MVGKNYLHSPLTADHSHRRAALRFPALPVFLFSPQDLYKNSEP